MMIEMDSKNLLYEGKAKSVFQGENPDEVIIDCEGLEYISSAGLRVLLIMSNECSGNLTAINIKKGVMEIIEQTGFDSVLNLDPVQG